MALLDPPGTPSPDEVGTTTGDRTEHARGDVRRAWSVHLFTTTGIVVGMLALQSVVDGAPKAAMVYLLLTQLIDGIDGPMARQYDVKTFAPKIDGYVLDLVIDYVTCVVVPSMFLHKFHLVPDRLSIPLVGLIVFMSAIWFSRTDMMTEDNWFNGFPATWNLVVPSMLLIGSDQWLNVAIIVILCALMITDVKFPHPVRSGAKRRVTLPVTLGWLAALTWATFRYPTVSTFGQALLVAAVAYFFGLSIWRTRQG